ncbi:MAG: EAL domain-containing protein [Pseudomonadota bacterium]
MKNSRVLIVTNDVDAGAELEQALLHARDHFFRVERCNTLLAALERLKQGDVDVVLLDLFLPDSSGLATYEVVAKLVPSAPIMTLSTSENEDLAISSVQQGAQAYLLRQNFARSLVPQSVISSLLRKRLEEALFIEKQRSQIALSEIVDGVISADALGNVNFLNATAERMTGWSSEEARGRRFSDVFHIVDRVTGEVTPNPIATVLQEDKPVAVRPQSNLVGRDGVGIPIEDTVTPIHDKYGRIAGAVMVFHDVTVTQAMMKKISHQANHDYLTDLPNRLLLNDRISHSIKIATRRNTQLALLFLDLDNFKLINDSMGHAIGDKLLQSVAKKLVDCVRSSDTVSRQGGDEFVILLAEDKHAEDAAITAEKILIALAAPHYVAGHKLHVTTSIGISVFPVDGDDADTLIKNADTAMYLAKKMGRNNYQFYKSEMNTRAVERQFIEAHLRSALEREEFVLYYQPIVDLKSGAILAAEALIRWAHPDRGLMLPDQFISIAEESGLIVPIGQWVLRHACRQVKAWIDAGLPSISISVNVSALEFRSTGFYENVCAMLHEFQLKPELLELELTETALLRDTDASAQLLRALKLIGIHLAIDDFGTGYSSLSYLKQFSIDSLKIDQSFVQDVGGIDNEGIIVNAVIGMGRSLQQRVVAEGVELQGQLAFLNKHDCEAGQGYYFSPPLAADQFTKLLQTGISQTLLN